MIAVCHETMIELCVIHFQQPWLCARPPQLAESVGELDHERLEGRMLLPQGDDLEKEKIVRRTCISHYLRPELQGMDKSTNWILTVYSHFLHRLPSGLS